MTCRISAHCSPTTTHLLAIEAECFDSGYSPYFIKMIPVLFGSTSFIAVKGKSPQGYVAAALEQANLRWAWISVLAVRPTQRAGSAELVAPRLDALACRRGRGLLTVAPDNKPALARTKTWVQPKTLRKLFRTRRKPHIVEKIWSGKIFKACLPINIEQRTVGGGGSIDGPRKVVELAKTLAIAAILALFIRENLLAFYVVDGNSMSPTLVNGQLVAVNKLVYKFHPPRRGDVVVFVTRGNAFGPGPERVFIKRVIAVPGDTVAIANGAVFLNGEPRMKSISTLPCTVRWSRHRR